jgi:hypothetical protein
MRLVAWMACCAVLGAAADIAAPATWRAERFDFPLVFAPSIPYEGVESVRFSPQWTKFSQPDGFTYVLMWDIRRKPLDPVELERALNVYFDGLMESATRAKRLDDPGTVSQVSLHPMATPEGWSTGLGGRLWTWNGFSRGEALVLNMEIAQRECPEGRTQAFFAFSMAPRDHAAWGELRRIRSATSCDAPPPATP